MRVAEAAAAYKEGDEAGEALFGETEDEAEDNAGSNESPLRWRRRGPTLPRPRGTNSEAEDTAGSAPPTTWQRTSLAQPRPHPSGNLGEDFHRSAEVPPAGNETEDITGSTEAPPRCQRGRATQKMKKSRTR